MTDPRTSVPAHWVTATLEEVAEVRLGRQRSPKRATGDHMRPYMRAANVTWQGISLHDVKRMDFTPAEFVTYELRRGDILLAEASGSASEVGKPAIWKNEVPGACFQNTLIRVRAPARLVPFLHAHFMSDALTGRFARASRGVGIHHLGAAALSKWQVTLPPIGEQRSIVQALDSYLSRLDDAVATLERVQRNLKRYRASVLKAAVEGRLVPTEAELARKEGREYEPADVLLARILQERKVRWIEREAEKGRAKAETRATEVGKPWTKADDQTALARARAAAAKKYEEPSPAETSSLPELPEGWCWATIEQMAIVSGGLTKNSKRDSLPIQVPYLRVANVYSDELRLDEIKTIGVLPGEQQRVTLEPGDLLVVEGNGSIAQIGRVAIWDGSIDGCTHQNHLIKVRLTEVTLGRWCLQWLLSPAGRGHVVKQASSTSGLHTLSISKVEGLVIPLCPREELDRIATEVDRLLTIAEASGGYVAVSELRASRLRQSILKWAFEGKLVDQDPNDEPASELLERIKAERENARAAAKAKKKPTRTKRKKKPA